MTRSLPDTRRIVTGHGPDGRSIIEEDGPAPGIKRVTEREGYAMANIWRTGAAPSDVHAPDSIQEHSGVLPPKGGSVIRVIDFPPEPKDKALLAAQMKATFRKLYPDADHTKDDKVHQGMHRTETVDYAIVLKGSITAIMDEGETVMSAGDILIQRGTNHAWSNRSDDICRIAFILIDGSDEK